MGRAPCCDKANVKKGPWSPEEDAKLKDFIHKFGTAGNWIALPQKAGLRRCGKSCRLRWLNYLRPNIKHGEFSDEEDRIICTLYASIGSRWSIIASQLPGRTDNDIKNYWNTKLKKKLLGKSTSSPFHSLQSSSTITGLSQLYTSLYTQATKSLITSLNNISSSPNNNFFINNNPTLFNGLDQFSYQNHQQPLLSHVDNFQYDNMNFPLVKDNMLMFGGNQDQANCSSDNSYKKDVKQEETNLMGSDFISDDNNPKSFYLDHYYGGKNNGDYSIVLDHDHHRKASENGADQLGYDLEEVKQLIIGDNNNNFLFSDD